MLYVVGDIVVQLKLFVSVQQVPDLDCIPVQCIGMFNGLLSACRSTTNAAWMHY